MLPKPLKKQQGRPAAAHAEGARRERNNPFEAQLRQLEETLDAPVYLAASFLYRGSDRARIEALSRLALRCGTPLIATNDVLYHDSARRALQDALTCIRKKCQIGEAGLRLEANAERHLKAPREMARLFRGFEAAVSHTAEIAGACRFCLDELVYEYPDEPVPADKTPQSHLEDLTWEGARWRFPSGVPEKVAETLIRELALIADLRYAPYFSPSTTSSNSPANRRSCARGAAQPPIRPSAIASASPASIPPKSTFCSSAS